MLKIYNLKEKLQYIDEISILTQKEWGEKNLPEKDFNLKAKQKVLKIKSTLNKFNYCKLILLDDNNLVGFISIFPKDCEERQDLSPWYATMYVKETYRGKGYSKILNDAIIAEARKRNFRKLYLKSNIEDYYEKFGAKYMETLKNGEKLYYIDIPTNRISIIGGPSSFAHLKGVLKRIIKNYNKEKADIIFISAFKVQFFYIHLIYKKITDNYIICYFMAPLVGLEPTTCRLTAGRSTN